jgi:hypothetical protein
MSYINTMLTDPMPEVLDFEPVLRPVIYKDRCLNEQQVPDKMIVVRKDTDQPLAVVGSRHRPTNYRKLWEPLREGLIASDLDLTDATVKWHVVGNGAAMFADITLKAYNFEHIIGEPTSMKMRVLNSVNGSWKYDVSAMLMRLACLNGMSRVDQGTSASFKHTVNTDPQRIGDVASQWPVLLESDGHFFNHMKRVKITPQEAKSLFSKFCVTTTKVETRVNKAWLGRMVQLWDNYSASIGQNGYALYNALTHYGTHSDVSTNWRATAALRGDVNAKLVRQEQTVTKFLRSPAFKKVVRYDDFALAA